ncbi:trans-sulfuration enzyme family protein [Clostridium arbusti]|uniref:trans-sulfuration enzyme family protein n=1 Tax=Clostridium arbusti TaxID=1137848 RepID=UPI000287E7C1|nr:PLP-dependent aspartate aminotransferase family protein [Clostridium arbusti]
MKEDCRALETIMVHGSKEKDEQTGTISMPIYQTATFSHRGLNQSTGYDYSRSENPTREELEKTIAKLEGGKSGFAFSTGMAAIDAVLRLFLPKDHVIVSEDLYGGTYRLFEKVYKKYGIEVDYVDTTDIEKIKAAVRKNTKAIFIETPSNPMMRVTDIEKIAAIAEPFKILTIVDNTFLTPYFQRPLSLGADIVIHSGTKFLGGHNDTLSGLVVANKFIEELKFTQTSTGAVLSPFDSWLILRGIKTLALRVEKQQENAIKLADWLRKCKNVNEVYYPGLKEHKGYDIAIKQATGFGSMISFTVVKKEFIEKVLKNLEIIYFAESLGGVESLITYPYLQTHAAIPEEMRNRIGVTDKLLRLSVGIENINDLIGDLDRALNF